MYNNVSLQYFWFKYSAKILSNFYNNVYYINEIGMDCKTSFSAY